jgi:hypothetical protein
VEITVRIAPEVDAEIDRALRMVEAGNITNGELVIQRQVFSERLVNLAKLSFSESPVFGNQLPNPTESHPALR